MKRIAFFDFDGTLTRRDTFWDFNVLFFGRRRVTAALIELTAAVLSSLRFDRSFIKEKFVSILWTGISYESYISFARRYASREIEKNLLPVAMKVFLSHIGHGDDVYIVTASMKDWCEFWAKRYGVPVIGTELEVSDGYLTGHLSTPNCRGREKVARIRAVVDLSGYSRIFAYGNSNGDREMLSIADEAVYRWDRIPDIER
ncbi:MAG: HAD-IB family hydrolase [Synergistaceae bacterium]|nr:HAD-IB family hydrolase [Synergistaceae bacterium]